jgi:hypothetical protein
MLQEKDGFSQPYREKAIYSQYIMLHLQCCGAVMLGV